MIMMTGYHISLGYNSGYSGDGTWEKVKAIIASVTPEELRQEYLDYETVVKYADGEETYLLEDFVEKHFKREDATIQYVGDMDDNPQIMLLASGAGDCRTIKEGLRRAFCRLLLHKAHQEHIEININVK